MDVQAYVNPVVEWLKLNGVAYGCRIVAALLILVLGAFAIRLLAAVLKRTLGKLVGGEREMVAKFLVSVAVKTCWAFLFVVVLGKLGVDVAPLIAGLGVTGFIVGFAFQESLGSLAAGLMIAINHPFKVGDLVDIAGHSGVISALDMMAVTLTTGDQLKITIPNKSAWGQPIVNYSAMEKRRVEISVGVSYSSDLTKALEISRAAIASVPGAVAEPEATAAVASLDDSAVTLCLRVWCANADYWPVRNAAVKSVKEALDKAGIEIPFPQMDVHMANG